MRAKLNRLARTATIAVLALSAFVGSAAPAAAGYPRRIAVAPFVSLTPEDTGGTVTVLPRLVASRLMALAGADVLLLPADGKSPEEGARAAQYPLLLQGTLSKIGEAYSIDVTVTDLATGGRAGAFYAASPTIDGIIPQLGAISGEIAEKVFGVQGAIQAASPPPPAAAPVAAPAAPPAIGGVPPAVSTQGATAAGAGMAAAAGAATAAGSPAPPATGPGAGATPPATLASGWLPASIKQVAQSDKVLDELNGVVALGRDAEGNQLVASYGRSAVYVHQVKGTDIVPFTRYPMTLQDHLLEIGAFDLDGDGVMEILVTVVVGLPDDVTGTVKSMVLKRKGATYEQVAEGIPYFLEVLSDWRGRPEVVGQYVGIETPFEGKFVTLRWDGKGFVPGSPFSERTDILPLSAGILGLSSARFGKEWRLLYTDPDAYLRIVDARGESQFKSKNKYGATLDAFAWGPIIPIEGRRAQFPLRHGVRVAPGAGDAPLVLTTEVKKAPLLDLTTGVYDSTRVVLLRWDGGDFVLQAGSPDHSRFLSGADFLSASPFAKGGRIIASVIEKQGSVVTDKVSRLLLFQAE